MPYEANPPDWIQKLLYWANQHDLSRIYSQKGGWEGWAQVELAIGLSEWIGGSIEREETVYTDGERADFLSTHLFYGEKIIELKCESAFQDLDDIEGFAYAFISDLIKVNYVRRKTPYQQTPRVVIGIGVTSGPRTAVERAAEIFSDPAFAYHDQTFWIQAVSGGPTIFYAQF